MLRLTGGNMKEQGKELAGRLSKDTITMEIGNC